MKNLEIERLRAVAVLAVICYHVACVFPSLFSKNFGSPYGVTLFFVISGFVVCSSFLRKETGTIYDVYSFYVRRIFRILPLAFLCIAYFFIRWLFNPSEFQSVPQEITSILLLRYNYDLIAHPEFVHLGFFWTLMVEEHFYLLFPILFVIFSARLWRVLLVTSAIALIMFVLPSQVYQDYPRELADRFMIFSSHARFQELLAGVLICFAAARFARHFSSVKTVLILLSWLAILGIVLLPALLEGPLHRLVSSPWLLCAVVVLIASANFGVVLNLKGLNKYVEYIGSRSFGLYLWHGPILILLAKTKPNSSILVLALALPLSLLVAEITYRLIEKPMINVGHRISRRMAARSYSLQILN